MYSNEDSYILCAEIMSVLHFKPRIRDSEQKQRAVCALSVSWQHDPLSGIFLQN